MKLFSIVSAVVVVSFIFVGVLAKILDEMTEHLEHDKRR